ncbi:MAG: hypothetical protein HY050_09415 [Actinobacteria bacterium]|nr:hypothetical protein [Actinomycetota bacterium]
MGSISNGGAYGYGFTARGKPNCWAYYLEFNLTPENSGQSGRVDINSTSAIRGIPNYSIHIKVLATAPNPTPTPKGIIRGQVFLGPICPVERIPPDPACTPKPFRTTVEIQRVATGAIYKSVMTDFSGSFTLSLDPDRYLLRATGGSVYPRCTDVTVQVIAGKSQSVIVNCDTGIR